VPRTSKKVTPPTKPAPKPRKRSVAAAAVADWIPVKLAPKVAVVGFADGHRDLAPQANDEWEVWGLNRLWSVMPDRKWTRWFELHPLVDYYGDPATGEAKDMDHVGFLRKFAGPVYVRPSDVAVAQGWGIRTATAYPIDQILNEFGGYFTNTVSWLCALAIAMAPTTIGMFGVDMAQDTVLQAEYSLQRPSLEFFLGVAQGRGIQLIFPPGCDLLQTSHLYGFEDSKPMIRKMRMRLGELNGRKEGLKQELAQLEGRRQQITAGIQALDGAGQDTQYYLRNLLTPGWEGPA
jgi:hypothetical protein